MLEKQKKNFLFFKIPKNLNQKWRKTIFNVRNYKISLSLFHGKAIKMISHEISAGIVKIHNDEQMEKLHSDLKKKNLPSCTILIRFPARQLPDANSTWQTSIIMAWEREKFL